MLQKITKNLPINIPAILICLTVVFVFAVSIKANPGAKIQFTLDTIVSLTGISDGDLYAAQNSECDLLSVSGSTLTVGDIPDGSSFILKTSTHNNALKITPSGGVLDLTFDSGNLSSGNITQWILNADSGTTVAHIIGASQANTWYAIKTDGVLFNSFQSSASGEVSLTYDGSFSSKVFTIEEDTTAPTEFSLISPINNATISNSSPTFSWNASSDPDLSYYQLYIDSSLDTDNINSSATSTTLADSLSCGPHTWYVKAIDNAGNSTNSSTFNLAINCGGLPPSAYNSPSQPEPTPENPDGGFSILINNDDENTDSSIVTLKLNAGADSNRTAISNDEDFTNASIIPYQKEIEWDLSIGRDEALPRLYDGEYTVYAKFYTQYGVSSEVVSDSIILETGDTETEEITNTETEKQSEDSNKEEPMSETKDTESPKDAETDKTNPLESTSFIFTKTLKFGSWGAEATQLQNKLKEVGFFPKEIKSNGNFGPITEQAVIDYQKSKGIYPCGIVGPRTRKALNNEEFITNKDYQFTQDLKYNDKNEEVKQLQTRLRDQNFFPYNIKSTSWFGPITQKAVNIFQKFYNLIQSGVVDEGMKEVLNR